MAKETVNNKIEREYVIPLRNKVFRTPRYKRAKKAINTVKEFLAKHMKVRDGDLNKIKIDKYLNQSIWGRGIKKPPHKIKVRVTQEGEIIRAEAYDLPKKISFRKQKEEKKIKRLEETEKKKKVEEKKDEVKKTSEEKAEEVKKEEKKEEEKEKKKSIVQAEEKYQKSKAKEKKQKLPSEKRTIQKKKEGSKGR